MNDMGGRCRRICSYQALVNALRLANVPLGEDESAYVSTLEGGQCDERQTAIS